MNICMLVYIYIYIFNLYFLTYNQHIDMDCRLEDDTLIDNGCFQVAIFRLAATQRITWKNNQDELTGTSSEVSIPPTYPLVNIQKAIENGH